MKRFDCLRLDCPIFGPHLLEASAGTGKTFAIEHVFVRLLLGGIDLEKILAVTFTKAAARELKERIQNQISGALLCLQGEKEYSSWAYLAPHVGSKQAIFTLSGALKCFDRCQIFTIHSFCAQMLREFSFEAGLCFFGKNLEDEAENALLRRSFLAEFWQSEEMAKALCPEQLSLLFGKYGTLHELGTVLLKAKKGKKICFGAWHENFVKALKTWKEPLNLSSLLEDFAKVKGNFKKKSGDLESQVKNLYACIANPMDPLAFQKLLRVEGSLFQFLDKGNEKVKPKPVGQLYYPQFFEWAVKNLGPIVIEGSDKDNIEQAIIAAWHEWEEKKIAETQIFQPDEILRQTEKAFQIEAFAKKAREKYEAVIVDEFQDTDPLQWKIFQKLQPFSFKAFYLVGDPKQSIYRFRDADVYTYLEAKKFLGEENHYLLDTNFRSSKELIEALNPLFSRDLFPLPKTGGTIAYHPVSAGSQVTSDLNDGKKSFHWILCDGNASFEKTLLPYAVGEIEKLSSYKSVALLVKDRYGAAKAIDLLKERQIPCVARSHKSLAETEGYQCIFELLEAIAHPGNENLCKIVEAGPFAFALEKSLFYWKELLEQRGLAPFFSECLGKRKTPFPKECDQVLEEFFKWEQKEGFSFIGLKKFLKAFEKREAEEGAKIRLEEEKEAVQVMTLFVSKGLEFDIVFALSLASSSSKEEDEESDAESLRQLYVAMTRAKKRLYVPYFKEGSPKTPSSMDLFAKKIEKDEGPFLSYLKRLSLEKSISWEEIATPYLLPEKPFHAPKLESAKERRVGPIAFSFIRSFSSMRKDKVERETTVISPKDDLPGGKETGTIVHGIFEKAFDPEKRIWQENAALEKLVEKELLHTFLYPWKDRICEMVKGAICQNLSDGEKTFCLKDLKWENLFPEMEFLFLDGFDYFKGFIDLVFLHEEKLYIVDWKTNILADKTPDCIEKAMKEHDYEAQANLYAKALQKAFGCSQDSYGGAFYLFARANAYVHLNPYSKVKHYG